MKNSIFTIQALVMLLLATLPTKALAQVNYSEQDFGKIVNDLRDESFELYKRAYDILTQGRDKAALRKDNRLLIEDSEAFLLQLPRWTKLWNKLAAYFNHFTPKYDLEAYLDASLRIHIALSEAEIMARYLFLLYGVQEYHDIYKECAYMKQEIILLETKIAEQYFSSPQAEILIKPLSPKPVNVYEKMPHGYIDIMKKYDVLERRAKQTSKSLSFYTATNEEIENSFRPIIRDYTFARLSLGDYLDQEIAQITFTNFTRIRAGLSHVGFICVYMAYRMQSKEWIDLNIKQINMQIKERQAFMKLFKGE